MTRPFRRKTGIRPQFISCLALVLASLVAAASSFPTASDVIMPVLAPWTSGASIPNGEFPCSVSLGRYAVVLGGATGLPSPAGNMSLSDFVSKFATGTIACYDILREQVVIPKIPPSITPAPTPAPNSTASPNGTTGQPSTPTTGSPASSTSSPDPATSSGAPSSPPEEYVRASSGIAELAVAVVGSHTSVAVGNTLWTLGMCVTVPQGVFVDGNDPVTQQYLLSVQQATLYETAQSSQTMSPSTVYMNVTNSTITSSNAYIFNASCIAQGTHIYIVGGIDARTGEVISAISQFDTVLQFFTYASISFTALNTPAVAADDSFIYAMDSQVSKNGGFDLSMRSQNGYAILRWTSTMPVTDFCTGPPSVHVINGTIFATCPPYSHLMYAQVLRSFSDFGGWQRQGFGGFPRYQACAFLVVNRPTNATMLLFGGASSQSLTKVTQRSALSNISLASPQFFGFYFHTPTPAPTPLPTTAVPPTTAIPSTYVPSTLEPSTAAPTTGTPTTGIPTTAAPSTAEPATAEPTSAEPSTAEPSTAEPPTADPSTAAPSTAEPSTAEPPTADPSTAAPVTAEPPTSELSTADPTTADPSTLATSTTPLTSSAPTAIETTADPSSGATTIAPLGDTTNAPAQVRPMRAQEATTTGIENLTTTAAPTTTVPTTYFPPANVPNSFDNITYIVNGYFPLWYNYTFDIVFPRNDAVFLAACNGDQPPELATCVMRLSSSSRCDVLITPDTDISNVTYSAINPDMVKVGPWYISGPEDDPDAAGGYKPEAFVYICFSTGVVLVQNSPCWGLSCPALAFTAINQNYPFILSPIITAPAPPPTPEPTTPVPYEPVPSSPTSHQTIVLVSAAGGCALLILAILLFACRARARSSLEEQGLLDGDVGSATSYQQGLLDGKYRVLQRLGKGSFSVVYLVERITDRRRFALKYVQCADDTDRVEAMKECEVVHQLQGHPSVIRLEDMFMSYKFDTNLTTETDTSPKRFDTSMFIAQEDNKSAYADPRHKPAGERYLSLVMEYHEKGDLGRWVRQQKLLQKVPEPTIVSIVYQILSVLHFMHNRSPPIVHRDLKPENILLSSIVYENVSVAFVPIVVTDFGLSRVMDKTFCETGVGSLPYVAPECWQRAYSTKVDIWAVGCILYAMVARKCEPENVKVMFSESSRPDFKKMIYSDVTQLYGYSDGLASFLVALLEPNKDLRPTALQCLSRIKKRLGPQGKGKVFSSLSASDKTILDSTEFNRDAQCEYFIPNDGANGPSSSPRNLSAAGREDGAGAGAAVASDKSIASVQFRDDESDQAVEDSEVAATFAQEPIPKVDTEHAVRERDFSLEEEPAASMKTIGVLRGAV